jgi:hypothetical protein
MSRTIFCVSQKGNNWVVVRGGDDQTITTFYTKEAAISFANYEALTSKPSLVVVQSENGKIEREWTHDLRP